MANSEHVRVRQQLATKRNSDRLSSFKQFGVQDLLNTKKACKASSSSSLDRDLGFSFSLTTQRRTIHQPDGQVHNGATFRAPRQSMFFSSYTCYRKDGRLGNCVKMADGVGDGPRFSSWLKTRTPWSFRQACRNGLRRTTKWDLQKRQHFQKPPGIIAELLNCWQAQLTVFYDNVATLHHHHRRRQQQKHREQQS
jgi:hypothetical protein